ncbi:MAG: hypothetical protein ACE5EY_04690, partial [Anaerolineae bacterium]
QFARLGQLDTQLAQFKDEVVAIVDQYDQRRIKSEEDMDRLRRVENEITARELADIRKELPAIKTLREGMEHRQAEESRLANLIGQLRNQISAIETREETHERAIAFLEEKEKQDSRNIAQGQADFLDLTKRVEAANERLEVQAQNVIKVQSNLQTIAAEQEDINEAMRSWLEQVQSGEYDRNQRIEGFQRLLDEQTAVIENFRKEWIPFSDQYKEAKMAVETLSGWQKELEQQHQQSSELLRVETHRLQTRWDDFRLENEQKWKNFRADADQRWASTNRHERQVQEQITQLEGLLNRMQEEKDLLQRIQTAQADAIKQLPRIWLEEVEKAVNQNPHRRRQPALVPVREE